MAQTTRIGPRRCLGVSDDLIDDKNSSVDFSSLKISYGNFAWEIEEAE
jgi:hypothetical protein